MDNLKVLFKRFAKQVNKMALVIFFFILGLIFGSNVYAGNISSIISSASNDYGVAEDVIFKVITVESSFDSQAVSSCDARGLMQVTRSTWNWICRDFLDVDWDFDEYAFDPEKNVRVGTRFLKWIESYLFRHENELNDSPENLVYACYNAGPGAVRNHGFSVPPFSETVNYINKINRM